MGVAVVEDMARAYAAHRYVATPTCEPGHLPVTGKDGQRGPARCLYRPGAREPKRLTIERKLP